MHKKTRQILNILLSLVGCAVLLYGTTCYAAPARILQLQRTDGFTRGVLITEKNGNSVVIGFTDTVFDDKLFLVQRDGSEAIFQVQEDGGVSLISGQQIDLRYILCIADAVLLLVDSARSCEAGNNICYARAILSFIVKVLNCSEPATTLSSKTNAPSQR